MIRLMVILPLAFLGSIVGFAQKTLLFEGTPLPFRGSNAGFRCYGQIISGQQEGVWVVKNGRGGIVTKGTYLNGKKHGDWVFTEFSGKVTVTFHHDQAVSAWLYTTEWYSVSGLSISDPFIRTDTFAAGLMADNLTLLGIGEHLNNGVKNGEWYDFTIDGLSRGPYREGIRHGTWYIYSESMTGAYINGIREGTWCAIDNYGCGNACTIYKNGKDLYWKRPSLFSRIRAFIILFFI